MPEAVLVAVVLVAVLFVVVHPATGMGDFALRLLTMDLASIEIMTELAMDRQ